MTTAIACEDLVVAYHAEPVVRGVTLAVQPAEVLAVLGPNGAGKTTLLKAFAGLIEQRNGSVTHRGQSLRRLPPELRARRGLLLVPEGRRLFPSLTTIENLRTGRFTGRQGFTVEEVLKLFPRLAERKDSQAGRLSGGEQQMLAIGRALCGGPDVLLIDEPSLGLAPLITEAVFDTFRALARRGIAIVVAEQNLHAAASVADRCVLMDRGFVVFTGRADDASDRELLDAAYAKTIDISASA